MSNFRSIGDVAHKVVQDVGERSNIVSLRNDRSRIQELDRAIYNDEDSIYFAQVILLAANQIEARLGKDVAQRVLQITANRMLG